MRRLDAMRRCGEMGRAEKVAAWMRRAIGRDRFESDMAAEIEFHIESRAEELERQGLQRAEALRQARLRFGGREKVTEEGRAIGPYRHLDELHANLRDALRGLRRDPGFALVAVLVVASVLAVNMVLFAFLDSYFLRPLPIAGAERHVELEVRDQKGQVRGSWLQGEAEKVLASRGGLFERAYLFSARRVLVGADDPQRAYVEVVSPSYFDLVRPRLAMGRWLQAAEGGPERAVLLSWFGWKRLAGGDPHILGKTLVVDGVPLAVAGVLAEGVGGLEPVTPHLWMLAGSAPSAGGRREESYAFAGVLRPGVSKEQAAAALTPLVRSFDAGAGVKPETLDIRFQPRTTLLRESRELRPLALALLFLFALVTLIAAANLTSLHLARATARRQALALRAALGATRPRLLRHLLTESLLLSGLAALLAWGLAVASMAGVQGAVFRLVRDAGLSMQAVYVDGRILLAGLVLAVLVGIGCGLFPALRMTQADGAGSLHRDGLFFGGKFLGGSLSAGRLRGGLVVLQAALSLPLLVSAGILVRSAAGAGQADAGYPLAGLVDLSPDVPSQRLLSALRSSPRVAGASAVASTPMAGPTPRIAGRVDGAALSLGIDEVDEAFFATTGIGVRNGRSFTPAETASRAQVAVISESTARRLWPGRNPLGRTLEIDDREGSGPARRYEVVGVAADSLTGWFFEGKGRPLVYLPAAIERSPIGEILVRLDARKGHDWTALRALCRDAGTFCEPRPMKAVLAQQKVPFDVASGVAAVLGLLALGLACLGLYGLVRFAVVQRARELGVRISLGATRERILREVLGQASLRVVLGLACGLPFCLALSLFLRSRIPILDLFDPVAYLSVPLLLLVAALLASFAPALRAAATDPNVTLREG